MSPLYHPPTHTSNLIGNTIRYILKQTAKTQTWHTTADPTLQQANTHTRTSVHKNTTKHFIRNRIEALSQTACTWVNFLGVTMHNTMYCRVMKCLKSRVYRPADFRWNTVLYACARREKRKRKLRSPRPHLFFLQSTFSHCPTSIKLGGFSG